MTLTAPLLASPFATLVGLSGGEALVILLTLLIVLVPVVAVVLIAWRVLRSR